MTLLRMLVITTTVVIVKMLFMLSSCQGHNGDVDVHVTTKTSRMKIRIMKCMAS